MALANLALAHEQLADAPSARLAARQARAVPGAPQVVVAQAAAVLDRLGDPGGAVDLHAVLDAEPEAAWPPLLRAEVARWTDIGTAERDSEARAWIDGQVTRPRRAAALAVAWLDAVLELPPAALDEVLGSVVRAVGRSDPDAGARFRNQVSRAMATFGIPQWERVRERLNSLAVEYGQEATWGT